MAKTDPVDPNVPPNSESPTLGAQRIRELARAVAEILNIDHYIGSDAGSGYTEDAAGEHSIVTGRAAGSIVTPGSGKMRLGFKTIGGVTELFTRDDAANEKQVTNQGKLNIVDADGAVVKTGNQTIAGIKTFSSSPVVPAPTTDLQASTKKYADDKTGTVGNVNPAAESDAAASTGVTVLANGLRIARGVEAVNSGAEDTISPSGFTIVYGAVLTIIEANNNDRSAPKLGDISGATFTIRNTTPVALNIAWIAIGR